MGDISENFSRSEFECKCGCGYNTVDVDLIGICESVREFDGNVPKTPSSGCRCQKHNERVGGGKKSKHLCGMAADFECESPRLVYIKLCERYPGKYGFGLYSWGVHIDSRSGIGARW